METRRKLATEKEVADYLDRPQRSLQQWRWEGRGPRWVKVEGRVRYRWSDVDAYVNGQVKEAS